MVLDCMWIIYTATAVGTDVVCVFVCVCVCLGEWEWRSCDLKGMTDQFLPCRGRGGGFCE